MKKKPTLKKISKKETLPSFLVAGLSLLVIVLVLVVSTMAKPSAKKPVDGSSMPVTQSIQDDDEAGLVTQEAGSIPAGSRVKFKIASFKKLALQPLEFEVFDTAGKALKPDDLKVVNEQRLHFMIVSANLKEFQHLYPQFTGGKWKILANLPNPGTYYAYVDIAPVKGEAEVLRSDLIVQGPTTNPTYGDITAAATVTNNLYKAKLALNKPTIYQQSTLSFSLTSLKDVAVTTLQNYLGALGHVVVFKQGAPDSFMHTNLLSTSDAKKGLVQFITTFSQAGRYVAFAEFKIGARVYTFPFVFEVTSS